MTARPIPKRHWRSYGDEPLPTGREECDRCGKVRIFNETHMKRGDMQLRAILDRMRHDGCGGRAGRVELLTGIEAASSRPVRKILLLDG